MKKAKEVLGFDDKWFMLIGIPVVALLINAMIFTEFLVTDTSAFFGRCFSVGVAYTAIYWLIYRQMLVSFRRKYPVAQNYGRRLLLQIGVVIVVFFILKSILDPVLHPLVGQYIGNQSVHNLSMTIGSLTVTFLVLGVYETAGFYFQLQKSVLEKERLLKENMQGQLESLKTQVNPHFFFNSLNTLSYLVQEDTTKAENFIQKLSKAYRYILEIREQELMPLEEELNFLDSYSCLLKERFGENLNIDIDVPNEALSMKVVPLSLQMLFENAIKHNVVSKGKPLTIELTVENGDKVVVKNNLQRKNQVMGSTKVGLENIKNRYRLVSGQEVEIIESADSFIVLLPLIENKLVETGS